MDLRAYAALEYRKVIQRLEPFAHSNIGKERISHLQPTKDLAEVQDLQKATGEGVDVLRLKNEVPFGGIRDIRGPLKQARIGSVLSSASLLDIASTIYSGQRLKRFFRRVIAEEEMALPHINTVIADITELKPLQNAIQNVVNDDGEILDSASPDLRRIRSTIQQTEREIRQKLDQIVKSRQYQKMVQEGIVTVRHDRYVIPVKQEYRAQFGGMVHDQSASGATVFIEPDAVVTLNHRLQEWRLKEEREIERLLKMLSDQVAVEHDALQVNIEALAELDVIFAKGQYAYHLKAAPPHLNNQGVLRLRQVRHPLIPLEEVVPIDVELGDRFTTLVITGPNTGGKTVTLKTIGLVTLMAMSGLYIPAEPSSDIAVFDHVFVDIGDEQSIEQNLSTFSGHMTHIIDILERLEPNSLILLDELGAGTDPTEGAALAIALLDYIHQQGCRVIATTHYNELKAYAYNRDNVMNASVEFDVDTLSPTYRLLIGVPGRSNALLIAERLGLNHKLIEMAKKQIGTDNNQVEAMIASLEANRLAAEGERDTATRERHQLEALRKELEQEYTRLDRDKERLQAEAKEEARQMVRKAKREADAIIQELRSRASQQTVVKEHEWIAAKKKLEEAEPDQESWRRSSHRQRKKVPKAPLQPGDEVYVHSFRQKGHVVEKLNEKELQVQLGILKVNVQVADVEPIQSEPERPTASSRMTSIQRSQDHVRLELDLRGHNVEEATDQIDKYLDDAVLAGYETVSLIHGKGTGVLRSGVQQFLRNHHHVKRYRLGGEGEGGSGVTVVELK